MDAITKTILGSTMSKNAKFLILSMIFLSQKEGIAYSLPPDYLTQLLSMAEYQFAEHLLAALGKIFKKNQLAWVAEGISFRLGDKLQAGNS